MAVEIKRVETKKDLKRFINFHYDLYQYKLQPPRSQE